jgi:heme oxygenase
LGESLEHLAQLLAGNTDAGVGNREPQGGRYRCVFVRRYAQGYQTVLTRLYGFWVGWQPQIAHLMVDETLLAPRRRLHLLAADLGALGVTGDALAHLPRCPPILLPDGMAALGSLYVVEGSTLGGRVILKNVQRRLGPSVACAYFHGYGANTGAMWLNFLARLNAARLCDSAKIGQGALATFERLASWLAPD